MMLLLSLAASAVSAQVVANIGKDCWVPCGRKGGKCDFCGSHGACCRQDTNDPAECGGSGHANFHTCQRTVDSDGVMLTPNNMKYEFVTELGFKGSFDIRKGISFQVKAKNDAHVGLFPGAVDKSKPFYEIVLSGWGNTASVIRRFSQQRPPRVSKTTRGMLSATEFRTFVVQQAADGTVRVYKNDMSLSNLVMAWKDPSPMAIKQVGCMTGWGSTGAWRWFGEPVKQWTTIFQCDGDKKTDKRFTDDWKVAVRRATNVRICTKGSNDDCVTAKGGNQALANLKSGNFQLQQYSGKCDQNCVNNLWSGPERRRKQLWSSCTLDKNGLVFHACGNHGGLHLSRTRGQGHCEWDWGSSDAVAVQIETPFYPPIPAPGNWITAFRCDGDGKTDNVFLARRWRDLAKASWAVRICTKGRTDECVTSLPGSAAMQNAKAGLHNLQPKGVNRCDINCIKKQWKGNENLLARLTWTCDPNENGMIYHACGNHGGLHIASGSKSHCEWDWGSSSLLDVQFLSSGDDKAWQEYNEPGAFLDGKWTTIVHCGGDGRTDKRVVKSDFAAAAKLATKLRICTTGKYDDCVYIKGGNPALENLRKGELNLQPANVKTCNQDCINKMWSGPERRLKQLPWSCNPNRGGMSYHACGNHGGLHIAKDKSHCEWDWGTSDSLEIQIQNVPTPRPTPGPTPRPTPSPTPRPTSRPTPNPTPRPTHRPTPKPTSRPTPRPTPNPTSRPTSRPTRNPTPRPTPRPTPNPTPQPTSRPTWRPTPDPTSQPTARPTFQPTARPTLSPTPKPTGRPTQRPTAQPTGFPSDFPTTRSPTTSEPTTLYPTELPTNKPTSKPTAWFIDCKSLRSANACKLVPHCKLKGKNARQKCVFEKCKKVKDEDPCLVIPKCEATYDDGVFRKCVDAKKWRKERGD